LALWAARNATLAPEPEGMEEGSLFSVNILALAIHLRFTQHDRLLSWHATERFEGSDVTAQCRRQILLHRHDIIRRCTSTSENSKTMRMAPGSPVNSVWNFAKSTCACCADGVSKCSSKGAGKTGLILRCHRRVTVA
jgi:hypothetical protein